MPVLVQTWAALVCVLLQTWAALALVLLHCTLVHVQTWAALVPVLVQTWPAQVLVRARRQQVVWQGQGAGDARVQGQRQRHICAG